MGECRGSGRNTLETTFYKSGVDSFFDFNVTDEVVGAINGNGRVAVRLGRDEEKIEFAYGILSMYTGNLA